jgi:peptide subunit release factor 1 (eRF1)
VRPLAEAIEAAPATLVVWTDARHARLVPVGLHGAREELLLQHDIPGHHSRGGWAQLAQSRYQRHLQAEQGRHLDAVADAVARLLAEGGIDRVVLAGDPETVGTLRERLPASMLTRVATTTVRAARHEPAAALVERALEALGQRDAETVAAEVDAAITEAAKGGRGAAGVAAALDAVTKGAVHRLYLLKGFREIGVRCEHCGALAPGVVRACPFCGRDTVVADLGETLVERVVASGGRVLTVDSHPGLAERGGIVAVLRHPLVARAAS